MHGVMGASDRQDSRRVGQDLFELRLAQELVDRELLTPEKLEEVLRQQVILGGHLATNIWELRLIDGRRLTEISAEILGVEVADAKLVSEASPQVRRLFAKEFVEQSRVLPFRLTGSVVQVATAEPWDHLTLGRAASHGGYPVEPFFLPEVPMSALLEKLYDIPTSARFWVGVHANEGRGRRDPGSDQPVLVLEQGDKPQSHLMSFVSAEVQKLRSHRRRGREALAQRARIIVQPLAEDDLAAGEEAPFEPLVDLKSASIALDTAMNRDGVGMALLRFALSKGKRAVLFMRRDATWVGWLGEGIDVDKSKVHALSIPDLPDTFFGLVAQTGSHYLGPMAPHMAYAPLLLAIGGGKPRSVVFMPVRLRGRLVFGLYLDGGADAFVSADIGDILVLAQRAPVALERLLTARQAARSATVADPALDAESEPRSS
jgi:hypothetical protein